MDRNRFNGFTAIAVETVKTVSEEFEVPCTGLKPGVNERALKAKLVL